MKSKIQGHIERVAEGRNNTAPIGIGCYRSQELQKPI